VLLNKKKLNNKNKVPHHGLCNNIRLQSKLKRWRQFDLGWNLLAVHTYIIYIRGIYPPTHTSASLVLPDESWNRRNLEQETNAFCYLFIYFPIHRADFLLHAQCSIEWRTRYGRQMQTFILL